MKSKLYCKILAIGIIVLFIGVGIHPAFAVEDKTSDEYVDNENPTKLNDEIYQNVNCFIIGKVANLRKWPSKGLGIIFLNGEITFGVSWGGSPERATGWILTIGKSVQWKYEGTFIGNDGIYEWLHPTGELYFYYIGVRGFRGICINHKIIGFADSIKIKTFSDNISR